MSSPVPPGKERITVDLNTEAVKWLRESAKVVGLPLNRFLDTLLLSAVNFSETWDEVEHAANELYQIYGEDTELSEEEQKEVIERFKTSAAQFGSVQAHALRAYLRGVLPNAEPRMKDIHSLFKQLAANSAQNIITHKIMHSAMEKEYQEKLEKERSALASLEE